MNRGFVPRTADKAPHSEEKKSRGKNLFKKNRSKADGLRESVKCERWFDADSGSLSYTHTLRVKEHF